MFFFKGDIANILFFLFKKKKIGDLTFFKFLFINFFYVLYFHQIPCLP